VKSILFVDDEPRVLQGLRRSLRGMRHEWQMSFVESAAEALQSLEAKPCDIIVSDMKMPGMDGAELLHEVKARWPETIRLILSGYSAGEALLKSVGPTHQYLSKPCDPQVLRDTIRRAESLRALLGSESLRRLVAELDSLPAMPSLFRQIVSMLQEPNASLDAVGELIEKDLAMSGRILQMMNSAYFGLRNPATSVPQAVSYLGLDTVLVLVLTVQIFSQFEESDAAAAFSLEALRQHSMRSGLFAKAITLIETRDPKEADDAFTAAMLHDCGKLILATNLSARYELVHMYAKKKGVGLKVAEREVLGATHAEVGAYLVGLWGLPDSIVEAVAFHENPSDAPVGGFGSLTAVHVANYFDKIIRDPENAARVPPADLDYLRSLGVVERLPTWLKACRKIAGRAGEES
jgi:HD-like signal output (HDOD) protein/CheY-like chemotaxis protein